jgi:thioredoxin 1
MKKLTLLKFGASWCPPCREIERRGTLQKFAKEHPDVTVKIHDDTEAGSARHAKLADEWGVKSIPCLIWTANGEELLRSYDCTARGIEEQYQKAIKKADRE